MKKVWLVAVILAGLCVQGWAIFGIEKILPDLNLFKQEVKGDMNGIKFANAQLRSEVTGLRMQVKELKVSIDAQNTAVAGFNNTVQKINVGGDNNDTDLMWKIINGLLLLCGAMALYMFKLFRQVLTEMSNARFYQTRLAAEIEPDQLEVIMQKKKELDRQKTIMGKAVGALRSLKKQQEAV